MEADRPDEREWLMPPNVERIELQASAGRQRRFTRLLAEHERKREAKRQQRTRAG